MRFLILYYLLVARCKYRMRRWLSGLRRTIGNRVTVNPVRRFKSSSPRQNQRRTVYNAVRL